jgi:DNA (cytosine-5)-methyltransferase 1
MTDLNSVELFAGAGGLGIGVSFAGFNHRMVIEYNRDSCDSIMANRGAGIDPLSHWPECAPTDVRSVSFRHLEGSLDLISGGPPCQPFSIGGKHRGHEDSRNMFPQAVRAVREAKPKAFLLENVKGLLRQSFASYFGYIELQLQYPEIIRHDNEEWLDHRARLEQHHTSSSRAESGLEYKVVYRLINAADFGVPQRRERVIIVGIRSDLGIEWSFPPGTHSMAALTNSQTSGEYWERYGIPNPSANTLPPQAARAPVLPGLDIVGSKLPWVTVRDALANLPDPRSHEARTFFNHTFVDGARQYIGHTGSPLDEPAKTLKAGDHGVPGGENMLRYPDGNVRYFTVREAARLQTFPDDYRFSGSWGEAMRQLGNAVPVKLAEVIARSIRSSI